MVQNSYHLSENSWAPEFIAASAKKLTSPKTGAAGTTSRAPTGRHGQVNGWASGGAALRSRAAGSQDESRYSAIHKQRP
jgi:hypothetical protein